MLLGIWRNVEDLEECLNIQELELIVSSARDREYRQNKFLAALKGIDLDANDKESAQEKFEAAKRRVEAQQSGKSVDEVEFGELGIEIEYE